ncbi:hypothetical protein Tco_0735948 [Tanacetum coccineum]
MFGGDTDNKGLADHRAAYEARQELIRHDECETLCCKAQEETKKKVKHDSPKTSPGSPTSPPPSSPPPSGASRGSGTTGEPMILLKLLLGHFVLVYSQGEPLVTDQFWLKRVESMTSLRCMEFSLVVSKATIYIGDRFSSDRRTQRHLNTSFSPTFPDDKKVLTTAINLWIRNLVIRQRVEDFQLGIESYQTQLNLTKPRWDTIGFEFKLGLPKSMKAVGLRVNEFRVNKTNPGMNNRLGRRKTLSEARSSCSLSRNG